MSERESRSLNKQATEADESRALNESAKGGEPAKPVAKRREVNKH